MELVRDIVSKGAPVEQFQHELRCLTFASEAKERHVAKELVGPNLTKAISFMSDTTNVMKGARSGVQKLIKNEHPHLYDVGCICHLADLTVKAGMETLPVNIDQLFIDVFYYFFHSSKRKQEFCNIWCSLFTSEPTVILKHCPTRWLSLLRCVGRYLSQYDGLKSFFLAVNRVQK